MMQLDIPYEEHIDKNLSNKICLLISKGQNNDDNDNDDDDEDNAVHYLEFEEFEELLSKVQFDKENSAKINNIKKPTDYIGIKFFDINNVLD